MEKYTLIPEQLIYEGTIREENLFDPGQAADDDILRVHDREYLEKLKTGRLTKAEIRRMGFPYSPTLMDREVNITQGTL